MVSTPFLFLEGNPAWLDFVNTELALKEGRKDLLGSFSDLLRWLGDRGLLGELPAAEKRRAWEVSGEGGQALVEAAQFREILRRLAAELERKSEIPGWAAREINRVLATGQERSTLVRREGRWELLGQPTLERANQVLLPLARSTAEFLTRTDLKHVRKCANPACILYFYDISKNHARRWCSMALCGNRMKAAEFHRRHRDSLGGSA